MARPFIWLTVGIMLCSALVAAIDGLPPVGRLALRMHLPQFALKMLDEPLWAGIAHYRNGEYERAVDALRIAGPDGYFYRANALAHLERYEEAQAILDAHLFRFPEDEDGWHNRAIIGELYKVVGDAVDGKFGMPIMLQTEAGNVDNDAISAAVAAREQSVRQIFDDQGVTANQQWISALPDEPGRFLRARIAAEHERRLQLGTATEPTVSPW